MKCNIDRVDLKDKMGLAVSVSDESDRTDVIVEVDDWTDIDYIIAAIEIGINDCLKRLEIPEGML